VFLNFLAMGFCPCCIGRAVGAHVGSMLVGGPLVRWGFRQAFLSFAEIDVADSGDGLTEEGGAEALEFFYGVGGVEAEF
jgi:hypothetical protein